MFYYFSLISNVLINIHEYAKLDHLYIILLGYSVMSQLLIGNKFDSLEELAADFKLFLYVPPYFSIFSEIFISINL